MGLLLTFLLGYSTGIVGFLAGAALSGLSARLGKRANGAFLGFTGGVIIAFVCFELLPRAFEMSGVFLCILGMLAGIMFCALFEKRVGAAAKLLRLESGNKYIRMGILICIGVCAHNIPEGMAIGSLAAISPASALKMSAILALHCIPEAMSAAVPMRMGGVSGRKMSRAVFLLALPIGIGSCLGFLSFMLSGMSAALFLSFSGGTMIYLSCGEILPESKNTWKGRIGTVAAGLGFIAGVLITTIL